MTSRPHHRPTQRDAAYFDEIVGGQDPALVSEAADRAAALLVRGARSSGDDQVAERLLHLADTGEPGGGPMRRDTAAWLAPR